MKALAQRMQQVQSPVIPVVGEMIRAQPGVISLGQGVVHYGPPSESAAAITEMLETPKNHLYQPVDGIPQLTEMIAAKLKTENQIELGPQRRIIVTAGGNMAFMNAILSITDPGDEIVLIVPYYFNHEMAIAMASCRPVLVPVDERYQPRLDQIDKAITDRTRAVVTISPNNPTGAVYSEDILRQINGICRSHGIYHINDEAYEYFTYDGATHFSPGSIANSTEHTICLYSLSKAYGFASWRIGYMVAPEQLLMPIKKAQDTIVICPPVVSQFAAAAALKVGPAHCRKWLPELSEVRKLVLDNLKSIDRCTVPPTKGAFYFLVELQTSLTAMEIVQRLINQYKVAAIPGDTFGMEHGCFLRIAYGALRKKTVATGIGRLVEGLREIL